MTVKKESVNLRMEREQGDINTTTRRRKYWERNLSQKAKKIFERDKRYFLHQSLSTPVLNVLSRVEVIHLPDIDGNGVHNV